MPECCNPRATEAGDLIWFYVRSDKKLPLVRTAYVGLLTNKAVAPGIRCLEIFQYFFKLQSSAANPVVAFDTSGENLQRISDFFNVVLLKLS